MIEAIIFDFDGVLLESAEIKTEAFQELFSVYPDLVQEIVEYHKKNMGISRYAKFRYFYENILGEQLSYDKERELGIEFSQIALNKILAAPAVRGALEFLNTYYKILPLFIASGTPEDELLYIVKNRNMSQFFKEIHGSPKKKTEIILDIISRYDLESDEVVFVGDALSDLKASMETGVYFIARISEDSNELRHCRFKVKNLSKLEQVIGQLSL